MNNHPTIMKKTCLFATAIILILSFNSYSQSYLPLTGGTLTGNLGMSSGTQIQTPYLGFSALSAQPANSSNFAIFPNSSTGSIDIVGQFWRFIPSSTSSYQPSVLTIDGSGNTTISGNTYVAKNLGIGTTSPSNNLQIGTQSVVSTTTPVTLSFGGTYSSTAGMNPKLKLFDDGGNFYGFGISSSQLDAIIPNGGNFAWYEGGAQKMILNNAGNVGIGTTSPVSRLNLAGGGNANPNSTGSEVDYSGLNLTFTGTNTGGTFNLGTIKMVQPNNYYVDHADMVFYTAPGGGSNTEKMRVTGGGNVLIGRTTQQNTAYMLDVNGAAHATSVVVNANGADFVFDPTYHLNTLSFVEKYINQKHHLPEIPSAKQMQADGLNVGNNQIKLLQKVEELTLYLIEKDKQINNQNQVNTQLLDKLKIQQEQLKAQQTQIEEMNKKLNLLLTKIAK